MTSKVFILSGDFGSGKTMTALSFVPHGHDEKVQVNRIVVDPEIRSDNYLSKDGQDHPTMNMFGFRQVNKARLTGPQFFGLMKMIHDRNWGDKGKPDVIIIDDTAKVQEIMTDYWQNVDACKATAALYGKDKDRVFGYWKPKDPGVTAFFKVLFEEFILDMKEQDITVIITSPLHNIWENYGSNERDENNKPKMKIVGQSAKVWDVWQKMTDVIWDLSFDLKNKVPLVQMDPFIRKASLPGVPEEFLWPGWTTIWQWHDERKYVADISKIKIPEPKFDADSMALAIRNGKARLVEELKDTVSIDRIKEIMADEFSPVYDLDNHEKVKAHILLVEKDRISKLEKTPISESKPE